MDCNWIDTHAHLADTAFAMALEDVLVRASVAGVHRILCVGVDRESSLRAVAIASESRPEGVPNVWASVGIHPNYAHQATAEDWSVMMHNVSHPRVCALGETGLDKYWDDCPFDVQLHNFSRHWQLSRETGLPVIVHSRDCDTEMLQALRREFLLGPLNGVMHSFAGSSELASECIAMGLHISFSGILTYKKSDALRAIASTIPMDRLLLETDAPYLSPDPKRAIRPNEPALLVHTAAILAHAQSVSLETLAERTTGNALRLFSKMK